MERFDRILGSKGEGYVVMQAVLFAVIGLGPWLVRWQFVPRQLELAGRLIGFSLLLVGLLLALAGVASLGNNITAVPRPKEDAFLVRRGAYRLVRHPIYSGILLGSLGWSLFSDRLFVLLATICLFLLFDVKSRREEQWLAEKYESYDAYRNSVRKLIPFLY